MYFLGAFVVVMQPAKTGVLLVCGNGWSPGLDVFVFMSGSDISGSWFENPEEVGIVGWTLQIQSTGLGSSPAVQ